MGHKRGHEKGMRGGTRPREGHEMLRLRARECGEPATHTTELEGATIGQNIACADEIR